MVHNTIALEIKSKKCDRKSKYTKTEQYSWVAGVSLEQYGGNLKIPKQTKMKVLLLRILEVQQISSEMIKQNRTKHRSANKTPKSQICPSGTWTEKRNLDSKLKCDNCSKH